MHLSSGPFGAKVPPHAFFQDSEATREECNWHRDPHLLVQIASCYSQKGDDKDLLWHVWWGWYGRPGPPSSNANHALCKLKAQRNFRESKRDKKPNKVGPKASWNYVVFCPVAGDPVTDACDYGLCKQLSGKFIRFPKAAEEQMWSSVSSTVTHNGFHVDVEYSGFRSESLCPGGGGCWDWRFHDFLVVFSCCIIHSWPPGPYKWWSPSRTVRAQCLTLSSYLVRRLELISLSTSINHASRWTVEKVSLWPTLIGWATAILTLLAKFTAFRLALFNTCLSQFIW